MANVGFISVPLSDSDRWCVVRLHVCWGGRGGEARSESAVRPASGVRRNPLTSESFFLPFHSHSCLFLSSRVYHVPTFNNRPQHVSHVLECAGMHAECV